MGHEDMDKRDEQLLEMISPAETAPSAAELAVPAPGPTDHVPGQAIAERQPKK